MLKVNEYGGRQAKGNEKRQCFKGWETLVTLVIFSLPFFIGLWTDGIIITTKVTYGYLLLRG